MQGTGTVAYFFHKELFIGHTITCMQFYHIPFMEIFTTRSESKLLGNERFKALTLNF